MIDEEELIDQDMQAVSGGVRRTSKFLWDCPYSSEMFSSKSDLNDHIREVHPDQDLVS